VDCFRQEATYAAQLSGENSLPSVWINNLGVILFLWFVENYSFYDLQITAVARYQQATRLRFLSFVVRVLTLLAPTRAEH
jgi:hypothetical protein